MSAPVPPAFGYGAYSPPAYQHERPAVILWFRTYAAAMAVVCGGLAALLLSYYLREGGDGVPWQVYLGFGLALPHAVGAAVPYKPWAWTYALVLISLGMFSFMLPFAIGLFLFWRDPKTKAAFRRFV